MWSLGRYCLIVFVSHPVYASSASGEYSSYTVSVLDYIVSVLGYTVYVSGYRVSSIYHGPHHLKRKVVDHIKKMFEPGDPNFFSNSWEDTNYICVCVKQQAYKEQKR